jgi:DNA-binding transcriptional LysR family regulator
MNLMARASKRHVEHLRRRLKPRQLELLAALSGAPSLSAAAKRVYLSQPAATKLLKTLSADLDVALFERVGRVLRPTAAGEALIFHATRITVDLERAQTELDAIRSGAAGHAVLGALVAACHVLVPRALARLRNEAPGVIVTLLEGTMDELMRMLRDGRIDLIVGRPDLGESAIDVVDEPILEAPLRIVVAPEHPLARARRINLRQVLEAEWILPPRGTPVRRGVERLFRELRARPRSAPIESASIEANVALLRERSMVVPLSENVARQYEAIGRVKILNLPPIPQTAPITMVRLGAIQPASAVLALMQCLRVVGSELGARRGRSSSGF